MCGCIGRSGNQLREVSNGGLQLEDEGGVIRGRDTLHIGDGQGIRHIVRAGRADGQQAVELIGKHGGGQFKPITKLDIILHGEGVGQAVF